MNEKVLSRFIKIMVISSLLLMVFYLTHEYMTPSVPGDYEVRKGDILLSDRKYDEAIHWFDEALRQEPGHRGAMMGRAISLMESGREDDAEHEFGLLIDFLDKNLEEDDRTGWGVKAAAYANRGILKDRQERHAEALDDYRAALRIDDGAVEGLGVVSKVLYGLPDASSVRDRAKFLFEQLALPEDQRMPLRIPEKDSRQRMHKP